MLDFRTRVRRVGGLVLFLGLVALASGPAAASAPAQPGQLARSLERQGKLSEALRVLERVPPKTALGEHAARLRLALRALEDAAIYRRLEQHRQAERALRAALAKLHARRDVFVAAVLHLRLREIGREGRMRADAEARATLEKAGKLEARDNNEQAAAVYKVVAERSPSDVSELLIHDAKLGQLRAETAVAATDEGFFAWVWGATSGTVKTIAKILFYAALVALAILILVGLRKLVSRLPPRKRTTLAVEDLGASVDERNARNRTLTRELTTSIKALGVGRAEPGAAEIDEIPDLDGTYLANLRVVGSGLEGLEASIHEETPIKIGPVSFNPRQVLFLGGLYFSRRSQHDLRGTLVSSSNESLLTVELSGSNGDQPEKRWATSADGTDARSKVIKDMATRIVFDLGGSQISSNWPSFREYRAAMGHLSRAGEAEDKVGALTSARLAFQRSLDHDPANLLARFNLSNVLRKLGENEAAVEHYAFLRDVVSNGDPQAQTPATKRLLERHPEFPLVVRYNRAAALSKIDDWNCHNDAISELEDLIVATYFVRHLQMLAWAAWSSALVFRLEKWRHEAKDPRLEARRRQLIEHIEQVRDWLEELPKKEPLLEWSAFVSARAAVQSALGRGYYLVGRDGDAYAAYERALSMTVDLPDVCVHMASLLIRRRTRFPRWSERAEAQLKRAIELNSADKKARFLLGILYKDPVFARYDAAKKELAQVDDVWALFHLAEIHEQEGKLVDAVASLRRSLRLNPDPDVRSQRYLENLLELNKTKRVTRAQLEDALTIGERLFEAGTKSQEAVAKKLLSRIRQALAARSRAAA